MQAMEIYQQDQASRRSGVDVMPRQEYYMRLRDALHAELMQDGRSDYLDEMLQSCMSGEMTQIYMLDYAVLVECHGMVVRGRPMTDALRHVPHIRTRGANFPWADMKPRGAYLFTYPEDFPDRLQELQSVCRQMAAVRDDTLLPHADSVLQREISQLQLLNRALEGQNADLRAERDALKRELEALKDGYITEQVKYALDIRRRQEEAKLEAEMSQMRQAAADAYQARYGEEMTRRQWQREAEDRRAAQSLGGIAVEYDAVRQDIARAMQDMQSRLSLQLQGWQEQLQGTEGRLLARSFVSLWSVSSARMTALLTQSHCLGAPDALMQALHQMEEELHAQLRQMEQAMLRLGLQVLRPEAGEAYDERLHFPAGVVNSVIAPDARILRCTKPGVASVTREKTVRDVLVRAEVDIAATGEGNGNS